MPTPPSYSQLLNPSENLAELIAYQNNSGLTAGLASGAEPYDVLIGKAAFNAQQQSPVGAINTVVGTADEIEVSSVGGAATVGLPDVISLIGKTVVGGTLSSVVAAGTFTGPLTGNVTGNVTGSAATITGVNPVVNGGTGQSSFTNGQIMIGNTAGNTLAKSTLTAGANITITNGAGSISIAATSGGYVYNVKNFGAVGDGVADDTVAVNAAIAALLTAYTAGYGSVLYFPSGIYLVGVLTPFTDRAVYVMGDGPRVSLVRHNTATGILFYWTGVLSSGGMKDISVHTTVARTAGYPLVKSYTTTILTFDGVDSHADGDLFYFETGNWISLTNVFSRNQNTTGGVQLKTLGVGLSMDSVTLSNYSSANTYKYPTVILEGQNATGTRISNCSFGGGGPRYTYTGATIADSGADFTVTFTGNHNFGINEYIVITGAAPAGYNGYWRVDSKAPTTVTVVSAAALGAGTTASVHSVPCCALITNTGGAYNESQMSGVMFEGTGYPTDAISASLIIDGTKGNGRISGWKFDNCYYDYGKVGVMIIGGGTAGTNDTSSRLQFNGSQVEGNLRLFSIEEASGVIINGLQGPGYNIHTVNTTTSAAIYIWGRSRCQGHQISDALIGGYSGWYGAPTALVFDYGVLLEGAYDSFMLSNSNIQGVTAAASGSVVTKYITSTGNKFFTGNAVPPTLSSAYPVIASAATITVPWNDIVVITGTTNIDTISGGWEGREIILICTGGVVLTNAGNIVVGVTVVAGRAQKLIMRSTNWVVMQ
jgi:hypothetical protein